MLRCRIGLHPSLAPRIETREVPAPYRVDEPIHIFRVADREVRVSHHNKVLSLLAEIEVLTPGPDCGYVHSGFLCLCDRISDCDIGNIEARHLSTPSPLGK